MNYDMKKRIFIAAVAASLPLTFASSQDLDKTVSITNSYKTEALTVHKRDIETSLPDSLLEFDYNFDYSVFDAPYKGAYEFSPYNVVTSPETKAERQSAFYLKAGAGYSLHPELKAVWTPFVKGRTRLSVYQDFSGYYGKYRTITDAPTSDVLYSLKGSRYVGHDLSEKFGASLRTSFKAFELTLGAEYFGIFAGWKNESSNLNGVSFSAGVRSAPDDGAAMLYRISLGFTTLGDYLHSASLLYPFSVCENIFKADVSLSPRTPLPRGRIFLDLGVEGLSHKSSADFSAGSVCWSAVPHYDVRFGPVYMKLGLKLSGAGNLLVCPDVALNVPIGKSMVFELSATGGTRAQNYLNLKRYNSRYTPRYNTRVEHSADNILLNASLRGSVAGRLQYSARVMYADVLKDSFWGVRNDGGRLDPALIYGAARRFGAVASVSWKSGSIDASGEFRYMKTFDTGERGIAAESPFSGNLNVIWNYRRRIFAGVSLKAASDREILLPGVRTCISGYCDLGVYGEYRMNRKLSFYLKGGNLLNEGIQVVPFVVENGINITGGILLKL